MIHLIPAIVQALLTLPSSCPLTLVTIHFNILINNDFNLYEVDWSPLSSPSLFGSIQQIDLRISATNDGKSVSPSRIVTSLTGNAQLMSRVEQGLIIVTAEEEADESL